MSDTLIDKIVEAGARAMCSVDGLSWDDMTKAEDTVQQGVYCDLARACLTAALAAAEAEGVVLVRVAEEAFVPQWDDDDKREPWFQVGETYGHAKGHNTCRAATLAGKVTL
jgi:hypothetical protein